MLTFTDTEVTKEELLGELHRHAAADRFIQGAYWQEAGRGCAVGCTLHSFRPGQEAEHRLYEPLFGIPRMIAHIEDHIFELKNIKSAKRWPVEFAGAVPVGADLANLDLDAAQILLSRAEDELSWHNGTAEALRLARLCMGAARDLRRSPGDSAFMDNALQLEHQAWEMSRVFDGPAMTVVESARVSLDIDDERIWALRYLAEGIATTEELDETEFRGRVGDIIGEAVLAALAATAVAVKP